MPTPIERQSVKTDLESKYNSMKVGGSFNAKDITTTDNTLRSRDWMGTFDEKYTAKGFRVKMPILQSELKDVEDGIKSKELSELVKGLNTNKYKP